MVLPDPPYLYDDPRLTYDEHCFFYDGGYDNVCLTAPAAVVIYPWQRSGGSSGSKRKKKPYLNVFIKATLLNLNQQRIQLEESHRDWVRFAGEDDPIGVFINGITLKMTQPYVEGYLKTLINSTSKQESLRMSLDFVPSKEVPQLLETPEEDIQVKIIESYQEIQITCSILPRTSDPEK